MRDVSHGAYNGSMDREWRQKLLLDATRNTLEIAVGAGGNFQFYKPDVKVTALDFSPMMIEKAQRAAKEYRISSVFHIYWGYRTCQATGKIV